MNYSNSKAVFFKEIRSYFYSLSSYIFIIVFLTIITWLSFQNFFIIKQASMRGFASLLPWFFLFLIPALAMRIWSEEKRQGTHELLLTLPLTEWEVVLAKFLGGFSFIGVALLFSLPIPITLSRLGNLDWGPVVGMYIGAWLMGGALMALGQFISSLTKNQIVAFLLTAAASAMFIFVGTSLVLSKTGILSNFFYIISTITHFENLNKGVIDLRDVVYYVSFIGICLYLNVYVLNQRHWK
ncbi:MAG: ABC-type transport system involved in cytochrome c biogenesis, permease component [Parcubacteria group bacterium GW2011_GWA2_38_13]|nr:MAG: ABC-type transport system involved in cytochrome c biogenesis, permease component [Parcubacteria group bacterium GW2011_GWA2_38_13]